MGGEIIKNSLWLFLHASLRPKDEKEKPISIQKYEIWKKLGQLTPKHFQRFQQVIWCTNINIFPLREYHAVRL